MPLRAARSVLMLLGPMALGLPAACQVQQAATTATTAPALPPYLRQSLYPKSFDAQAQIKWPPNNGCAAAPVSETLAVGTLIDRFGSEGGIFFSPKGESFDARAVPYVCSKMVYTVYRVDKPLHVMDCKAAPWFDEPGGATQFQTDDPAFKLRESGSTEVVPGDSAGNSSAASPCKGP
jgi:Tuberculosis necrotizing toxin